MPVLLPDGCELVDGLVLNGRDRARAARGRDRRRARMYQLLDEHPESADELLARVSVSRTVEPALVFREEVGGVIVAQMRRGQIKIPAQYLPPRCKRMMRRRDLNAREAYVAAMYVYFRRMNFLVWGVGTNFPRHEKVHTSVRAVSVGMGRSLHVPAELRAPLDWLLIQEGPFASTPGVGDGCQAARHHRGKSLLRASLLAFSRILSAS